MNIKILMYLYIARPNDCIYIYLSQVISKYEHNIKPHLNRSTCVLTIKAVDINVTIDQNCLNLWYGRLELQLT